MKVISRGKRVATIDDIHNVKTIKEEDIRSLVSQVSVLVKQSESTTHRRESPGLTEEARNFVIRF